MLTLQDQDLQKAVAYGQSFASHGCEGSWEGSGAILGGGCQDPPGEEKRALIPSSMVSDSGIQHPFFSVFCFETVTLYPQNRKTIPPKILLRTTLSTISC